MERQLAAHQGDCAEDAVELDVLDERTLAEGARGRADVRELGGRGVVALDETRPRPDPGS